MRELELKMLIVPKEVRTWNIIVAAKSHHAAKNKVPLQSKPHGLRFISSYFCMHSFSALNQDLLVHWIVA